MPSEIWFAAAEAAPVAQVGGLADVLRALPAALARQGFAVRLFLPAYGFIDRSTFVPDADPEPLPVPLGAFTLPVRFLTRREVSGVHTTLVVCDEMFARDGVYGPPGGEYPDNARRFALFGRAVAERSARAAATPAILHVHDWHAALVPLFVRFAPGRRARPRTVLTVHNMGYQGRFGADALEWIAPAPPLRDRLFRPEGIEYYGDVSYLKAGLMYADRITAVSPRYAWEISTPEGGFGLDGVVRDRLPDLVGILNGADYEVWNPAIDRHLPAAYDRRSLDGKEQARAALRRDLHLGGTDRPVLGVVGRLVHQKGIDVLAGAAPALLQSGADLAVLGAGDGAIVDALERLRREHPGRIGMHIGFDERLAHLLVAGSDLLLVPSRYEPCGLTQLHALKYGTPPVVRRTGGLADTVRDQSEMPAVGTGFVFDTSSPEALAGAVRRALRLRDADSGAWRLLQQRGMAEDFSWDHAAARYAALYRDLIGQRRERAPIESDRPASGPPSGTGV